MQEAFDGKELVPLAIVADDGQPLGNRKTTTALLKEYFRDSAFVLFDEIDNSTVSSVSDQPHTSEAGAEISIVYLPTRKLFVERKRMYSTETNPDTGEEVEVSSSTYTTAYSRASDFLTSVTAGGVTTLTVRTDKVFFNVDSKVIYIYNGNLVDLFDTVRINAMTEEEFNKLENPIEGAFYATYE